MLGPFVFDIAEYSSRRAAAIDRSAQHWHQPVTTLPLTGGAAAPVVRVSGGRSGRILVEEEDACPLDGGALAGGQADGEAVAATRIVGAGRKQRVAVHKELEAWGMSEREKSAWVRENGCVRRKKLRGC